MDVWDDIFGCKQLISYEQGWVLPSEKKYGKYFINYKVDEAKIESGVPPVVVGSITVDARGEFSR